MNFVIVERKETFQPRKDVTCIVKLSRISSPLCLDDTDYIYALLKDMDITV